MSVLESGGEYKVYLSLVIDTRFLSTVSKLDFDFEAPAAINRRSP
jgi:hypothetical protein